MPISLVSVHSLRRDYGSQLQVHTEYCVSTLHPDQKIQVLTPALDPFHRKIRLA